jgi:glyoxylase-like metal-dependent hydrolase (beta-lactamase superfamily II)
MSAELAFNRSQDVDYGVAQEVVPGVRRIVANNPGPYTFLGTNSYVVGSGEVAVIDPGPACERHLKAIAGAIRGERLAYILVTHSHRDHCAGARALQALAGGRVASFGPAGTERGAPGLNYDFIDPDFVPDHTLADGDCIRLGGLALDVLHMPGHAPDHLCFALVGKRTLFTGDHVMGWNTTVIAPPEGNMALFLASLERLMHRHDKIFLPAHGGRIQTPQRVVKAYMMHRKWREQTILACLDEGMGTIPRIVERLYGRLDAELKQAAALSVLAHLEHLASRDLVAADGPSELASVFYVRAS